MQTELCVCVVSDSPLFFFLPLKFSFYSQTFLLDIRLLWLWESERRTPPWGWFWKQQRNSQPIMRPSSLLITLGASGMP